MRLAFREKAVLGLGAGVGAVLLVYTLVPPSARNILR